MSTTTETTITLPYELVQVMAGLAFEHLWDATSQGDINLDSHYGIADILGIIATLASPTPRACVLADVLTLRRPE